MSASDNLSLSQHRQEYKKCGDLEKEFVNIKSEIEIMKSKNKALQEEAEIIEGSLNCYENLIRDKEEQISCLQNELKISNNLQKG